MASKSISLSLSHTLTLTVSNTIDNANNRSWIAWTLTVSGDSTWYDTYVKATVNGSVVYNKTVGWNGGFPAQTGSTSGGFYVNHNNDGTKSISMALEGYVYSYSISYTSGTLTCSPTDRSAPNVTTTVSGVSHNSCTLNISSTDTIASSNGYAYQIKAGSGAYGDWIYNNNGSWTITGLTPNTAYTINGAAKKSSNNVWGYQTYSFTTLGQATLSSASNTTLGNNATFKWTPLVASYQYRLQIKIGNTVIATYPSTTGYITGPFTAGTEYTHTQNLPLSLASYITTSMSATATAVLTTYNGSTQIGEVSSKNFIITVPENSNTKPTLTVSSITLGEGTTSGFGVLTTGYSTLKATIPTSAIGLKYSTTVNSIKMTVNNKTFTGTLSGSNYIITTSTLVTPGTHNVTFVLQDNRGLTVTGTIEGVVFYEYFSPNGMISSEVNNTSDGFITNISWNVASVNGQNSATVTVQRKLGTTVKATDSTTVNSTNNNYSSSKVWTQTGITDATTATYSYRLTITDAKKTVTYDITTSQICISRLGGGKGVTLFGEAQREGFWIVENGVYKYQGAGSVEYIKGTQGSSTNIWTGVTKDLALYDGKMIMYVLPYAGTSSGATLNLTLAGGGTTGAKAIYRYGGTTQITTHYAAGSRILLIYDSANNRWNSSAWYYSDSNNKVAITAVNPASETTYYPLMYTATSGTVGVNAHVNDINKIRQGTTSQEGWMIHQLGNSGAYDTDGNSKGYIRLYGSGTGYGQITYTNSTANTTHVLPANANMAGTILEIVEEGTWSNGKYIKYSNGTAECYGWTSKTTAISSSYGSGGIYYTTASVTFPSIFTASPSTDITLQRNGGLIWPSIYSLSATSVSFYIGSATAESSATIYIHVQAKGSWK